MDTFDQAMETSKQKYLQHKPEQQPGGKTSKLLDEAGSLFDQPTQQQPKTKKTFTQKMAGMADKVNQFKNNQQGFGTVNAVAAAQSQKQVQAPEEDQNSLFAGQGAAPQQTQQQAQQQTQQQTQQPASQSGQIDIQMQQQFNALPPAVKQAYGNDVRTYINIKKLEQQHNVK